MSAVQVVLGVAWVLVIIAWVLVIRAWREHFRNRKSGAGP